MQTQTLATGLYINPQTQDFDLDENGNLVIQPAVLTEAYLRFNCPYGAWIYDKTFGNRLWEMINKRQITNPAIVENLTYQSLLPMQVTRRINNLQVFVSRSLINGQYIIKATAQAIQGIFFTLIDQSVAI